MECSLGCTWCQEILLILISFFMIVGGVLVLIVFGDLLTYHRVLLPVALVITCGVVGTIACYVVHYQRFVEAEQSRWLLVLTGAFFVCCGLGCYVCLAYYVHKDIHLGKMDAYTVDVHNKEMIDKTQMLLECCGEHSYTDWFNVDWQGTDIEPVGECSEDDNIMSRASVPFSCCSPDAAAPCIHDYLQMDQDSRLYRRGCKPALVAVASLFALIFGLLLLIMGVLMLLWAFFGTDEECDDDCECEYEDKISILMPPSSFAESQSATEEGKSTVSVYNAAPEVVKPPAGATLGDDKYQTPEERSAQVLADHERVLRQISPSSYRKSTTVSSSTAVESIYSDTESEESFASEYSSA